MVLFGSDPACPKLLEYLMDVDGSDKTVYLIIKKCLEDLTYYWSSPDGPRILPQTVKVMEMIFNEMATMELSTKYEKMTMKEVHQQLTYLFGLPKDLQVNMTRSLKNKLTKMLKQTEPYASMKSSSR